ncbi:DUF4910 domain-containing protein [Pantoea agglomerans]|uniref:DUF4910 domain-containing protein n=1 Tax=Enterobacter agglomerans TaxID=549 RepID=UPI00138715FF|nr:DUF4910 domain-containing protein [Pantoea agglomerans]
MSFHVAWGWILKIDPLILQTFDQCSVSHMMMIVDRFSLYDRYQASAGIQKAAEVIASAARKANVPLVEIHQFKADNQPQWWSFRAPLSWTPLRARMTMQGSPAFVIDHVALPFALATYSHAACGKQFRLCSHDKNILTARDVVVIPAADFFLRNWEHDLSTRGAAGFVTDAFARYDEYKDCFYRGRIELAPGSPLFAFSLLPNEQSHLLTAISSSDIVEIDIVIDTTEDMPVFSACLPGIESQHEIWVTAHLCHARAGANDNASGVSVMIEAARLINQWQEANLISPLRYTLRLVSGPEFTGVAALQHEMRHKPAPLAVINLDMVGEDQELCESPFCIERPPVSFDETLVNICEALASEVFVHTCSEGGNWMFTSFLGFSDHALFMNHHDTHRNAPAIQIGHINDRFNHTAADTTDKVSPLELKRTLAVVVPLILKLQNYSHEQLSLRSDFPSTGVSTVPEWSGPLNLRDFIESLPNKIRMPFQHRVRHNKFYLALLHNCLIVGCTGPWELVFNDICNNLGLPEDDDLKDLFKEMLSHNYLASEENK